MLFTTHDMEDIEKICNRVIVIDQGKNIFDGSLETIRTICGKEKNIIVELEEDAQIVLDGVKVVEVAPKTKKITFLNESINATKVISQLLENYPVKDITVKNAEIESVIKEIYQGGFTKGENHASIY